MTPDAMDPQALLQLQQALKDLNEIHLPPPVTWWPLANSVWALLVGIFGVLMGFSWYQWKRYQNNRYRREALLIFTSHQQAEDSIVEKITSVNQLLKQVAMTNYGRNKVAALSGKHWVEFLQQTCIYLDQPDNLSATLQACYGKQVDEIDANLFFDYAQAWIKGHHK